MEKYKVLDSLIFATNVNCVALDYLYVLHKNGDI